MRKSAETALHDRLVWVCGDTDQVEQQARELQRSRAMVAKYRPRRESLVPARKLLLQQEENRAEDLQGELRDAVAAAWLDGRFYFRGRSITPKDYGDSFAKALLAAGNRILPELYPHFVATAVVPTELLQLVEHELSGPSPKFLTGELGILELDSGRYVAACGGVVPRRVLEHVESEGGVSGTALLTHFGGPPYGYTPNVVKACVAGLLRGGKIRIQAEGGGEITAVRDAGVRDLFEKDRDFRRASFFPAGDDDVGVPARAKICKFFERELKHPMEREDNAIADAVAQLFPAQAQRLRTVLSQLDKLPGSRATPTELTKLNDAFEQCVRSCRQTKPTVMLVKKHLEPLQDGVKLLNVFDAELTDEAVRAVRDAATVSEHHIAQLRAVAALDGEAAQAAQRIEEQLKLDRPWREIGAIATDLEVGARRVRRRAGQAAPVAGAARRASTRPGEGSRRVRHAHGRSGSQGAPPVNGRGYEYDRRGRRSAVDLVERTVRRRAQAGRGRCERTARRDPQRGSASDHREGRPGHPQSRGGDRGRGRVARREHQGTPPGAGPGRAASPDCLARGVRHDVDDPRSEA